MADRAPDRIAREESVFYGACELEPGTARDHYLERACHGDPALRLAVDRLLSGLDWPLSAFGMAGAGQQKTPTPLPGRTSGRRAGERIGLYELESLIGEGGMGEVWRVKQREPVLRQVALKIMKPSPPGSSAYRRFEAERQAMAAMNHPNIARFYDGGISPSGEPYFVMELVEGTPITEHCREPGIGTAAKIGLFAAVCRAVHHAHQRGVIHRDLKPSNVLVCNEGGKAVPKVIDFGVAKVLARARSAARDRDA
jgi:serine/threonine protein kinase